MRFLLCRKKNDLEKEYVVEFVDVVVIDILWTNHHYSNFEKFRMIYEKISAKGFGDKVKEVIKYQFHSDIYEVRAPSHPRKSKTRTSSTSSATASATWSS